MLVTRRRLRVLALVVVLVIGAAVGLFAGGVVHTGTSLTPAQIAARAAAARARRLLAEERRDAAKALDALAISVPTRVAPEPAVPAQLFKAPLATHQVVGFVPYWTFPNLVSADYVNATTLCFYGVSATGTGALQLSGPEWGSAATTLASANFTTFVTDAHAAGDRVLLTLASSDDAVIAALLHDPSTSGARLASELSPLVAAHGLDGVNIDIEGQVASERSSYVRFVAALTAGLRRLDATGQLMLDSYAGSAGRTDFFDVKHLAPLVDSIFVEGYDMSEANVASANAPLATNNLGYSEAQTLIQYTKVVPADKLILGLPFYGYDFTTRNLATHAKLRVADPEAVTYAAVKGVGRPAKWDPVAASPFASFRLDGKTHETYYDDPLSLAAKVALASEFHLLGVGAWAYGMEGGDTAMVSVLAGDAAVVKLPPTAG